jgi:hypothetical protein
MLDPCTQKSSILYENLASPTIVQKYNAELEILKRVGPLPEFVIPSTARNLVFVPRPRAADSSSLRSAE